MTITLLASVAAEAGNVDLVTLPGRDSVQLTIYNAEDITLVRETRQVTLKRGPNQLQFSWANTLIDPTSLELRPLDHGDEIEIVDSVIPRQKPQHLIWNIESAFEGQVAMEVSYFTSGLTWKMDYVAIADPDETALDFTGYVRVFNNSGEEYDHAEIRLIVGTINLTEKIAELARRYGIPRPQRSAGRETRATKLAYQMAVTDAEEAQEDDKDGDEGADTHYLGARRKQIVKEGLSEYFLFSIEGTETIANGWSKRMEAVQASGVPFDIVYRMRAHQYGPRPVRFFIWANDEEHELGVSPMPNGMVSVFRRNGQDGLAFLGRQLVRYTPITDEIEINLGPDDLVVYKTQRMSTQRSSFNFTKGPQVRPARRHHQEFVDGWDERTKWVDTIRNYRTKPIIFELHRQWPGDVTYESEVETTLFDYQTTETTLTVPSRDKVAYPATVLASHGVNRKDDRVQLKGPK